MKGPSPAWGDYGTITMHVGKHKDQKATDPTLLELLLRLEGDIRRIMAPVYVTPSQAGVLLFLRRRADARVTDAATALGVRLCSCADS